MKSQSRESKRPARSFESKTKVVVFDDAFEAIDAGNTLAALRFLSGKDMFSIAFSACLPIAFLPLADKQTDLAKRHPDTKRTVLASACYYGLVEVSNKHATVQARQKLKLILLFFGNQVVDFILKNAEGRKTVNMADIDGQDALHLCCWQTHMRQRCYLCAQLLLAGNVICASYDWHQFCVVTLIFSTCLQISGCVFKLERI